MHVGVEEAVAEHLTEEGARGLSRRNEGTNRSTRSAIHDSKSTSRAKAASTPGRRTLTATSSPSGVRAKWTCAIEAAATGVSSNAA
jgi:hypothetical protein